MDLQKNHLTKWIRITAILKKPGWILAFILMIMAGLKTWIVSIGSVPFNSDEAVVALMARHILQGQFPIFFYGQAYMGSLDAFLVAGGFAVFGQQVWVIRLVQSLLYAGVILTTFLIGKRLLNSTTTGLIAAALLAIPTVNVTLYTTASLGGYGEALLIGNFSLLAAHSVGQSLNQGWKARALFLLWGWLAGLGLWANALSLIFSVPGGIYIIWKCWRPAWKRQNWAHLIFAILGFALGALPWWIFAARYGLAQLLGELTGGAVAVEAGGFILRVFAHLSNFILLGGTVIFGMRPPWQVSWLGLPLLPLILILWAGVLWISAGNLKKDSPCREERSMLAGIFWTLLAGFLFTSFGVDPSGRYFVPLAIPLALAVGESVQHINLSWLWRIVMVGIIILYNLWGTIQCALSNPPGITTQFYAQTIIDHRPMDELIQFLKTNGETRGYTTYWVAYPLAFLSQEDLIFIPRLPYHTDLRYTSRDDRYQPYTDLVTASEKTAYITARNPPLDEHLRNEFQQLGVQWQEKIIGDYHVFYQLSKNISPIELGLGD